MMEGILICVAPHCLKSFLKKADFESHIQDSHGSLLRPNADKEDGNESEAQSVRQSTASDSTARGPQRPVFSPGSNSQQHDLEDKSRRQTHLESNQSHHIMVNNNTLQIPCLPLLVVDNRAFIYKILTCSIPHKILPSLLTDNRKLVQRPHFSGIQQCTLQKLPMFPCWLLQTQCRTLP